MPRAKKFFKFIADKQAGAYRQVATDSADLKVNQHNYTVNKGDLGGLFYLSSKPEIKQKQTRDLTNMLNGKLTQNTWLDRNSSLKGDYQVPLNSVLINTQITSKTHEPLVLDNTYSKNSQIKVKQADFSSYNTNLDQAKFDLNNSTLALANSDLKNMQAVQVSNSQTLIENSNLDHVKMLPNGASQLVTDSKLKHATIGQNVSINHSNLDMKDKLVTNSVLQNKHDKQKLHEKMTEPDFGF